MIGTLLRANEVVGNDCVGALIENIKNRCQSEIINYTAMQRLEPFSFKGSGSYLFKLMFHLGFGFHYFLRIKVLALNN